MSIEIQSATQTTEALIHQYGRLVFRVIYGLTGDWHESQDLTQDTFVQAFKQPEEQQRAEDGHRYLEQSVGSFAQGWGCQHLVYLTWT